VIASGVERIALDGFLDLLSLESDPLLAVIATASTDKGFEPERLRGLFSLYGLGNVEIVSMASRGPGQLLDDIRSIAKRDCKWLIVHSVSDWSDEDWLVLDRNRSALLSVTSVIFVMDSETLGGFLCAAPNLKSFVGARIYGIDFGGHVLAPEDIEVRLADLRSLFGWTDELAIAKAKAKEFPDDSRFFEWLVLLGRGDLLA
jgi:hypothetical protein